MNTVTLGRALSHTVKSIQFGGIASYGITSAIKEISDGLYHINFCCDVREDYQINRWQVDLFPSFSPDFTWAPHLAPTDDTMIAQHVFRSPALIAADKTHYLALIPDLTCLACSPVQWFMDMEAYQPGNVRLSIGISDSNVCDHVLFAYKDGTVLKKGRFQFAFYIIVSSSTADVDNPWRKPLSFLWSNWGKRLYDEGNPTTVPPAVYTKHIYHWAFQNWPVWQEFMLDGKKVGAPSFIVNVTQSPNYPGEMRERETLSIWNQVWFSSLRSASGLYRAGKITGNSDYIKKANMTKEIALSAPQRDGLFPSVLATKMADVEIDGAKYNRSLGWDTAYWGNSNRNPLSERTFENAPYHIADMSFTAYLMLVWYDELDGDERLLAYVRPYADKLVSLQKNGFFPGWLDAEKHQPMGFLDESPESSLSVTFLLKAYELFGNAIYLDSALSAMDAVSGSIIPSGRWEDFETYWSCCAYGRDHIGKKFERNNMFKQCNLSMFWTAEALYHTYHVTKKKKYLALGQRCLDELLMTQASWQPPYMHVNVLGGFGVMNCDGEWNDSRQSLFAELIMKYGAELGMREYTERGAAALKASFVMLYCKENVREKEQWEKAWPFFGEKDYGFMMENYGHRGETSPGGMGIGEFTIYDWGNGAAAEAYYRMLDHKIITP